jgi:hypothetical protein
VSDVQQGGNTFQLFRSFAHGTCEQDLVRTSLFEGPDSVEHVFV